MRKINLAKATPAKPATTKPATAKPAATPVLGAAAAAQATAGRSNVAKPATTTGKPAKSADLLPAVNLPPRHVNRTAATIAKQATNFGGVVSDRDTAYLRFWGALARKNGGRVTVADIAATGPTNPHYAGSAKSHDAGVAVRLSKAGLLTISDAGHTLTFTDKAKALAVYKQA